MTKQQVFLILPALAAAYGLGEAEFGEAKAAQEVVKQVRVDVAITGAGAISTFDSYIGSRACPLVDAAKSLSGNDVCNLAEDEAYRFSGRVYTEEGERRMVITVTVPVEMVETPGRLVQ